ncbi:hypothetical protein [Natranaeroarchaeum sulfidigenes]|uniref:Uncharacterized protein n=1 Tax=Natranaeroarchaeum sulfidigenes TaxID=2784880 RepID=A0A897MQE2_9EURY|nr:hypothetical protein [Natranaeroarchaeum sulfidigenes]QSG02188.1 hypothetical protein AArcS_0966 [Natranaeroarchaeum sulfidigenes]
MSVRLGPAVRGRTGSVCLLAISLGAVASVDGASIVTPLVVTPIGSDALERLLVGNGGTGS